MRTALEKSYSMRRRNRGSNAGASGSRSLTHTRPLGLTLSLQVRYFAKDAEVHPYKPWDDKNPEADKHFRAFKASANCTEWTSYFVPLLALYAVFAPALPLPAGPAMLALHWTTAALGLAFARYNTIYVEGYVHSPAIQDLRIPPALPVVISGIPSECPLPS